jgi:hypothetical protein
MTGKPTHRTGGWEDIWRTVVRRLGLGVKEGRGSRRAQGHQVKSTSIAIVCMYVCVSGAWCVGGEGEGHLDSDDNVGNLVLIGRFRVELGEGASDENAVQHEVQESKEDHEARNPQLGVADTALEDL